MFKLDMIEDQFMTFVEAVLLTRELEFETDMAPDDLFEAIDLLDLSIF